MAQARRQSGMGETLYPETVFLAGMRILQTAGNRRNV